MRNVIKSGYFILILLFCGTVISVSSPSTKYISRDKIEKSEASMLAMINIERRKKGLDKLVFDPRLRSAAELHNRKMIKEKKLSHDFPDYPKLSERLIREKIYFKAGGENIAYGSFYLPDYFHDGFMKSREHRENILDKRFTHCGIAVSEDENGFYVTEEFAAIFVPMAEQKLKTNLIDLTKKISKAEHSILSEYDHHREIYSADLAKKLLNGIKAKRIPAELEGSGLLEISSPEITGIKLFITDAAKKNPISLFSMSVAFGRTEKNPGGTYAVAMIYSTKRVLKSSGSSIETAVIAGINNLLVQSGKSRVIRDKRLQKYAKKINRRFLLGQRNRPRYRGVKYISYQTEYPESLPEKIGNYLKNEMLKGVVGIDVIKVKKELYTNSYFLITVTWRK